MFGVVVELGAAEYISSVADFSVNAEGTVVPADSASNSYKFLTQCEESESLRLAVVFGFERSKKGVLLTYLHLHLKA